MRKALPRPGMGEAGPSQAVPGGLRHWLQCWQPLAPDSCGRGGGPAPPPRRLAACTAHIHSSLEHGAAGSAVHRAPRLRATLRSSHVKQRNNNYRQSLRQRLGCRKEAGAPHRADYTLTHGTRGRTGERASEMESYGVCVSPPLLTQLNGLACSRVRGLPALNSQTPADIAPLSCK